MGFVVLDGFLWSWSLTFFVNGVEITIPPSQRFLWAKEAAPVNSFPTELLERKIWGLADNAV